ncbi:MAG: transglutaminase domain-containing protein [Spirochaetales bacterium]|nr:transglutaminase domain-containing protein [Spirochaetales bacterium]
MYASRNIIRFALLSIAILLVSTKTPAQKSIAGLFHNEFPEIISEKIENGYLMDVAVTRDKVYLLIQGSKGNEDVILKMNKKTGEKKSKIKTGNLNATAIISENDCLWVISRSNKYFLRQFSQDGELLHTIAVSSRPEGKLYGLAYVTGNFYFSLTNGEQSTIWRFTLKTSLFNKLFTVRGKIYSLTALKGKLYCYLQAFDVYAEDWLLVHSFSDDSRDKYHYIPVVAWGMDTDGINLYVMRRNGSRAKIYPFAVLEEEKVVLGNPIIKHIDTTYSFCNENKNPYTMKLWVPYPQSRPFHDVKNVVYDNGVGNDNKTKVIMTDRFGNNWVMFNWERLTGGASVTISTDVCMADVSYTIDAGYEFSGQDVSPEINTLYTSETYSFDYSDPAIQKAAEDIPLKSKYIEQVLAVHHYVNNLLTINGPSGPESRASLFVKKGEGRCYAHTVVFAAIARKMGIPARAVGGLSFDKGTAGEHTWNQVFFPGQGWIDIDVQLDDTDNKGEYQYDDFAYRSTNWWITFIGNYDEFDNETCFSQRGWYRGYSWKSLDRKKKAEITGVNITVNSENLPGW